MEATYSSPNGAPPDVLAFWRARLAAQDPVIALPRSPEWYEMMLGGRADGGAVAAVRSGEGRLCAVLPMVFRELALPARLAGKDLLCARLKTAKVCGGDLLEEGLTAAELAEFWAGFRDRYPAMDAIWLDHVECGPRVDLLRGSCSAQRGGFRLHTLMPPSPHYRLDLRNEAAALRAWRSRKSLARLRTKERALAREVGAVRIVEIRQPADWAPYEAAIEHLMNNAWQGRLLGHTLCLAHQQPVAERGWLRSFLLLSGARPAAFVLCYQGMGTLFYEQLGYDQALAKYSPGALLLYSVLERIAEADAPGYVDFGEGEAEYKKAVSNRVVQVTGLLVVREAPALRARLAAVRAAGRIDRGLRAGLRVSGLQRRVWKRIKGAPR